MRFLGRKWQKKITGRTKTIYSATSGTAVCGPLEKLLRLHSLGTDSGWEHEWVRSVLNLIGQNPHPLAYPNPNPNSLTLEVLFLFCLGQSHDAMERLRSEMCGRRATENQRNV
jgi:hypothetical protein